MKKSNSFMPSHRVMSMMAAKDGGAAGGGVELVRVSSFNGSQPKVAACRLVHFDF